MRNHVWPIVGLALLATAVAFLAAAQPDDTLKLSLRTRWKPSKAVAFGTKSSFPASSSATRPP